MIRWRVIDVKKRFARNGDYVPLANRQHFGGLETKREFLRRPTENYPSILAPLGANRNFYANRSDFVSGRVF